MSLKFSLRSLLILIAVISVACAALANAGIWWHSIVVSATLTGMTGLILWGTLYPGTRRAFACGWLLFGAGYLAMVFGPWTGNNLGTNFITSISLARLELKSRGDSHSPFVLDNPQGVHSSGDATYEFDKSAVFGSVWTSYPSLSVWNGASQNVTDTATTFQSTGHWLLASLFGYCGAHLAAFLNLRRRESTPA